MGRFSFRSGLPRVFADGRASEAYACRHHVALLVEKFGPFDPFTQNYAWQVGLGYVRLVESQRALAIALERRERGTGRRPSVKEVARLKKRVGLDQGAYDVKLRDLREFAQQRRPRKLEDLPVLGRGDGRGAERTA